LSQPQVVAVLLEVWQKHAKFSIGPIVRSTPEQEFRVKSLSLSNLEE